MVEVGVVRREGVEAAGGGFGVAKVSGIPAEGRLKGEVFADGERLLSVAELSRLLRIAPNTWRGYVARGSAPPHDGVRADGLQGWRLDTVRDFFQARRKRRQG